MSIDWIETSRTGSLEGKTFVIQAFGGGGMSPSSKNVGDTSPVQMFGGTCTHWPPWFRDLRPWAPPAGSGAEPQPQAHFVISWTICWHMARTFKHKMSELSMRETAGSDSFAGVDITMNGCSLWNSDWKGYWQLIFYHMAFNCYVNSKQHLTDLFC